MKFRLATIFLFLAALVGPGCSHYKLEKGQWALISYDEGVGRRVTPVKGADRLSFRPVGSEYAKDHKHVYFRTQVMAGADPSTFQPLKHSYSRDSSKVFWRERQIPGADPSSFIIVNGLNLWSKDSSDFYHGDDALGVLDVTSFEIINHGWSRDNRAFYFCPEWVSYPNPATWQK